MTGLGGCGFGNNSTLDHKIGYLAGHSSRNLQLKETRKIEKGRAFYPFN